MATTNSGHCASVACKERDFEISVGSTRLANVRDGVEDYDMISLLRLLNPGAAAEAVALFSNGYCTPCL